MTTLRPFTCDDLFRFNNINMDPLTETYGVGFYLQYLARWELAIWKVMLVLWHTLSALFRWPEYFLAAEAPSGELMGYIMGKAEGD